MFSIVDVVARERGLGRHILIVEDERLVSWSLTKALEKAGYCVSVAETGERAREQLSSKRFDLVITDLKLPTIDGYEVASCVDPAVPVIIISTSPGPAPEKAAELHHHSFVQKPFCLDEVTVLVENLLHQGAA